MLGKIELFADAFVALVFECVRQEPSLSGLLAVRFFLFFCLFCCCPAHVLLHTDGAMDAVRYGTPCGRDYRREEGKCRRTT